MEWGQFGGRVGLYLWGEPFSGRRQSSGQGLLVGRASPKTGVTGGWSSWGGQSCFNEQVSLVGEDN